MMSWREALKKSLICCWAILCLISTPDPAASQFRVTPGESIQAAIQASDNGDTIIVDPGVYHENINFMGKAVTIRSTDPNDPNIVDITIIHGGQARPVITFNHEEGSNSILSGLTLCHGKADMGAGIFCSKSSPRIINCNITQNVSIESGGGIFCSESGLCLKGTRIIENTAFEGGGLFCIESSPNIEDCTISDNSVGLEGGGIFCCQSSPSITKTTIHGNSAESGGGGIRWIDSSILIYNSFITENIALGPGSQCGGGIYCSNSFLSSIANCTIRSNSSSYGGGMYFDTNASLSISHCIIHKNIASTTGGGIYCSTSSPEISHCSIIENTASLHGGGICFSSSSPSLINCVISGNISSMDGGGILCRNISSPKIIYCTITGNEALRDGGGICCWGEASPVVSSCILWDDLPNEISSGRVTAIYSDIQGGYPGKDNKSVNPFFVDPNSMDYHLKPGSPCIDAGDPNSSIWEDKDDKARPQDGNYDGIPIGDMGAYEYPEQTTYEMNLPAGWSMISLPLMPSVTSTPGLFPDVVVIYAYEKGTGYIRITGEELKAGKGYWILLKQGKSYSFTGQPILSYKFPIYTSGWEMIGGCYFNALASVDKCDIWVIYGYVQGMGYQRIQESDYLEPCNGYWILLENVGIKANLNVQGVME